MHPSKVRAKVVGSRPQLSVLLNTSIMAADVVLSNSKIPVHCLVMPVKIIFGRKAIQGPIAVLMSTPERLVVTELMLPGTCQPTELN